jgi:hypothetical protein
MTPLLPLRRRKERAERAALPEISKSSHPSYQENRFYRGTSSSEER